MFLDGIEIHGFRSFGDVPQYINDAQKINIIIGKNNSGKSNILRFINKLLLVSTQKRFSDKDKCFDSILDYHRGKNSSDIIKFSLQIKKNSYTDVCYKELEEKVFRLFGNKVAEWQDAIWIPYVVKDLSGTVELDLDEIKRLLKDAYSRQEMHAMFQNTGWSGGDYAQWLEHVSKHCDILPLIKFSVVTSPAYRKITTEDKEWELSGSGLIQMLNKLKNPVVGKEADKVIFEQVNQFLRDILANNDAKLDIPHSVDDLYV